MKRFLMMMVAVMALFTLSGCGESKDSYVKDFTKFVEKYRLVLISILRQIGKKRKRNISNLPKQNMISIVPNFLQMK